METFTFRIDGVGDAIPLDSLRGMENFDFQIDGIDMSVRRGNGHLTGLNEEQMLELIKYLEACERRKKRGKESNPRHRKAKITGFKTPIRVGNFAFSS